MAKHNIIPIFIPFAGCPNKCIYCNQIEITGKSEIATLQDIEETIESYTGYFLNKEDIQVAFYGGTFTLLDFDLQKKYMEKVNSFIKRGLVKSIRISTKPDCIERKEILEWQKYGLTTVELGIQSTDPEVLKASGRRMDIKKVEETIDFLKENNFEVGLQQMIGLPKDTWEKTLTSCQWIVNKRPNFVRIYPTLVLKNTQLYNLYKKGDYEPLEFSKAIKWTSELLNIFEKERIEVIRVGLPPLENENDFVAGPYNEQFKEYAESMRILNKLLFFLTDFPKGEILIKAKQRDINKIVGPRQYGKKILEKNAYLVKFENTKVDERIEISTFNKTKTINTSTLSWSEICF